MKKKIIELGETGGCNSEITNLVHRVKRLLGKGIRVRLNFRCHDCGTKYTTEDYRLEIVNAKLFFGLFSYLNDGDGKIHSNCTFCKKKNSYGSYCGV